MAEGEGRATVSDGLVRDLDEEREQAMRVTGGERLREGRACAKAWR